VDVSLSFRRWRARHLLLAWIAYWLVLLVVKLGPALAAAARAVNSPEGHGKIDVSSNGGALTVHISGDAVAWSGAASLTSIMLWIAVPPLLLWLAWLVTRRAPAAEGERSPIT
jgi:hypothetical protein